MKTHQHAHLSAGLEKYLKKQGKKKEADLFCVPLLFVKGDRTLETLSNLVC